MIGSLSFTEIAFILVIALLIFGPKRLPEIGRMVGRGMGEFRRASSELKRTFNAEMSLEEDEPRSQIARAPRPPAKALESPPAPENEPEGPSGTEAKAVPPQGAVARGGAAEEPGGAGEAEAPTPAGTEAETPSTASEPSDGKHRA